MKIWSTRKLLASGNFNQRENLQNLETQSPSSYCLQPTSWEGFLERETEISSQFKETKWNDTNTAMWGIFRVRHSSTCSSSSERLFQEFTFFQESIPETVEKVNSSNYEYSLDRLTAANVTKDILSYWQGRSVRDNNNLCLFWFSAVSGRNHFTWFQRIGSNRRDLMELECNNLSCVTTLGILAKIQKMMAELWGWT